MLIDVGGQRTGGDATHAELRDRAEAQAQRAAENDLADGGREHHERRQLHVAGAAQNAGHRVHQPRHHRAAEEYLRIGDRLRQHIAAAAEQFQQRGAEDQHAQHEGQAEADADQQRMRGQRRSAVDVAGAERTRDRRRHAAAHRAARHGHGQDHDRKHQRHRGQRFHAQPADIGGLRDHDAGAGGQRDHVRPGQPQQRAQDRAVDQRVLQRRCRRRKRALLLVDRNFGNADIGHFSSPRADFVAAARLLPSMAGGDSTCAGCNGGLRDCAAGSRSAPPPEREAAPRQPFHGEFMPPSRTFGPASHW